MKYCKFKSILLIALGILVIGSVFLAGGCARTSVFIPEAIQLEPSPIRITADQLYAEYAADEAAADAKYKGKEVWVIEAKVDSYLESESGCYLMMRWYQPLIMIMSHGRTATVTQPSRSLCSVKLEPQFSEGFKDVGAGYQVEAVGECQGISDGVVTIKINRMTITGGIVVLTPPAAGW